MTVKLLSQDLLQFVLISFILKSWDTDMEFVTSAFSYMYTLCPFSFLLFPFKTMRKIEQQMNKAILNREDFRKDNTEVITISDCSFVYLHGNHIATVGKTLDICDAGWQTVTTKSRLNALLNEFAEGCYLFQKNFDWFLGDADGNVLPFPTEEFVTV